MANRESVATPLVPTTDHSLLLPSERHRRRSLFPSRPRAESPRSHACLPREETQQNDRTDPHPVLSTERMGAAAEERHAQSDRGECECL